MKLFYLLIFSCFLLFSITIAEDWPHWRGPESNGTWETNQTIKKWPTTGLKTLWSQKIGQGYSGISVKDGRVYTMDRELAEEGQVPDGFERVLCFAADTGKELWTYKYTAHYDKMGYNKGPRSVPTIHDGKAYILGAVGHFACLDAATGKLIWSYDLVEKYKAVVPTWGFAASPLIYKDTVILHVAAQPNGSIIAFNRTTGKEVWRSLGDQAGYSTPIVFDHNNKPHMILWTPKNIYGVNPENGQALWSMGYDVSYECSIVSPIYENGIVFISNGADGARAIELDQEHKGKLLWQNKRDFSSMVSQILYRNGHAYVLDKTDGLTCLEIKTGKKLWDDDNSCVPRGRNNHLFSVWVGNTGQAISLNSEGELVLAEFTPEKFTELSRAKIIDPTWAHPAYANNCVYARSDTQIVCVALENLDTKNSETEGKK